MQRQMVFAPLAVISLLTVSLLAHAQSQLESVDSAWTHSAGAADSLQELKPNYGEAAYWEQRYQQDATTFEWYYTYDALRPILDRYFDTQGRILQVGVGTSVLQYDMVKDGGYQNIVNTDISETSIKHMQEIHKDIRQLHYMVADARFMPDFDDHSFDGVLDKGTLDAILCGEHPELSVYNTLEEIHRVLKPRHHFLLITHGPPFARLGWLQQPAFDWAVSVYTISKDESGDVSIQGPLDAQQLVQEGEHTPKNMHYVYVCCKQCGSNTTSSSSGGSGGSGGGVVVDSIIMAQ